MGDVAAAQETAGADAADVAACRAGDTERFAAVVARHQDAVYGMALRFSGHPADAAELTQEAFLRAFAALHRFDARRPFRPWLLRIAANVCRDFHRRQRLRRPSGAEPEWEALPAPDPGPAEVAEAAERRQAVREAVAHLPPGERLVVALAYTRDLPLREVAAATGLPLTVVKNRLLRARRRLAAALAAHGPSGRR